MRIVHGWTLCVLVGMAQGCASPTTNGKSAPTTNNYPPQTQPMATAKSSPSSGGIQQVGHQTSASSPLVYDVAWPKDSPVPKLVPNIPAGEALQVITMWQNYVAITQDTQNQGQPLQGVAGRVFFTGGDGGHFFQALGRITVTLREVKADGQPSDKTEVWKIDGHTLQTFLRKDGLGWGYTLFLPWSTMRPDVKRVEMQVKFEPLNGNSYGSPLYSQPSKITFRQDPGAAPVINSWIDAPK